MYTRIKSVRDVLGLRVSCTCVVMVFYSKVCRKSLKRKLVGKSDQQIVYMNVSLLSGDRSKRLLEHITILLNSFSAISYWSKVQTVFSDPQWL